MNLGKVYDETRLQILQRYLRLVLRYITPAASPLPLYLPRLPKKFRQSLR